MVHRELCWDHVQSQTNSSGLRYLWTLFLSSRSLSLFLSLSLTSEPTALFYSCLATDWHVCVWVWVCVAEREERMWERERSSSPQLSLSPSLCQKCGWMLNISALSSSLSQYCGGCCCFRQPVQYDTDWELVQMPTTTSWYLLKWKRRLREKWKNLCYKG